MADRNLLEDEMLMTTLSGGASYCEINLHGKPRRVVVLAGFPIEFRTFCQIATGFLAGSISAYQNSIDESLAAFWEELGRPGELKDDPNIKIIAATPYLFDCFQSGAVSRPNYYQMIALLQKSQDIVDGKKANFIPMLAEISLLASNIR